MGVHTDLFVATESQLADVFVGWHTVPDAPDQKESTNPFTGEKIVVNDWKPGPLIKGGNLADTPAIETLPHYLSKRIDHVKLGKLHELITGEKYDEVIGSILKPALIHPDNEDTGLHQIPSGLASTLATLDETKRLEVAREWQLTEECQLDRFTVDDCKMVIDELHRLAVEAEQAHGSMYLLWSL